MPLKPKHHALVIFTRSIAISTFIYLKKGFFHLSRDNITKIFKKIPPKTKSFGKHCPNQLSTSLAKLTKYFAPREALLAFGDLNI